MDRLTLLFKRTRKNTPRAKSSHRPYFRERNNYSKRLSSSEMEIARGLERAAINISSAESSPSQQPWHHPNSSSMPDTKRRPEPSLQPSSLRCIVISHIINNNTKNVIFDTTRVFTSTLSGDHDQKEFTEVDDGFYALLGSVLGKSIMHMLLDHKAETDYRSVDRVILISQKNPDPKKSRSIVIFQSEPRPGERAFAMEEVARVSQFHRRSHSIRRVNPITTYQ